MEEQTLDLTELICDSVNSIFFKFFSSIDNSICSNLDNILFINSDMLNNFKFQQFFDENSPNNLLIIVNILIIGIVSFYAINYVVAHLIYSKVDSPYQFIFKCIIFISCSYSSFWLCSQAISFTSLITDIIKDIGYNITGNNINFATLIDSINSNLYTSLQIFDIFTFDGLIKFVFSIITVYILFIFSVRYIMCMFLILISPFAFLSLVNNKLDGFFKSWLKQYMEVLFIQIFVSLILITSFCVDFSYSDILSKINYISTLFIISKCNTNIKLIFSNIYNYSNNKLNDII